MLKYTETMIGLREIPDEISLVINISGCPFRCDGCHSPHLREDIGEFLTNKTLDALIEKNEGISCVCIMGGSNDLIDLNDLMEYCKKKYPDLKRAVYLGNDYFPYLLDLKLYDYIKIGHYDKSLGGLDKLGSNQRLKKIEWSEKGINVIDITHKFYGRNKK